MKKLIIIIGMIILLTSNLNAQNTVPGNVAGTGSEYCGWDGTGIYPKDLDLKNNFAGYKINFSTRPSGGALTQRATILDNGNVGIGLASPVNFLHQHTADSTNNFHQFTNTKVGSDAGNGFRIGIILNTTSHKMDAELNQQENASMHFLTQGTQRMSIRAGGTGALTGYVGIGNSFSDPQSRLHVNQGGGENCYFQMTGNNTGNAATDGFRIGVLNPNGGPYDIEFRQQENSSDYVWYTTPSGTTAVERMRMKSDGKIGIGISSPTNLLQLHDGYEQFTTSTTTTGSGHGFIIGVNGVAAELNQQEADAMNFKTSGAQRMQIAAGGNIGIGIGAQSTGKLYVDNDVSTSGDLNGVEVNSTNSAGSISGIKTTATGYNSTPYYATGISSYANNAYFNYGVFGKGIYGTHENYGGYFWGLGNTNTVANTGVLGWSDYGTNGIGGYFNSSNASTTNVGLYATASGTGALAGQFAGNILVNATLITSDSILKTNVSPLNNGLAVINLLQPKTYDFLTAQYSSMHLLDGNHAGLIAEDIEQVLPGIVFPVTQPPVYDNQGNVVTDSLKYKGVNYIEIIPYLIAAIKEQQMQIQALQSGAKAANPASTNQLEVKLSDKTVVLEQNHPNPFKDKTSISYNIPDDAGSAQILFYNSKGNVISTVEITERGAGSLLVYGSDLTSGIYTYTLLIDGKPVETKKMMKIE